LLSLVGLNKEFCSHQLDECIFYAWHQANLHLLRAATAVLPSAIDSGLIVEFWSKLNLFFLTTVMGEHHRG
jgi:hypothetical protein